MLVFTVVSAHPVVVDLSPRTPTTERSIQVPLEKSLNSTRGVHNLQDLFDGNTKFRQGARVDAKELAQEGANVL